MIKLKGLSDPISTLAVWGGFFVVSVSFRAPDVRRPVRVARPAAAGGPGDCLLDSYPTHEGFTFVPLMRRAGRIRPVRALGPAGRRSEPLGLGIRSSNTGRVGDTARGCVAVDHSAFHLALLRQY
jgi:hypothetical protein